MSNDNKRKKKKRPSMARNVIGCIILLVAVFAIMVGVFSHLRKNEAAKQTELAEMTTNETSKKEDVATESVVAAETDDIQEAVPEQAAEPTPEPVNIIVPVLPEAEDGSGAAGLMPMDESIMYLSCQDGWFVDNLNSWYSPDMVHIYYNGWQTIGEKSYHFDAAGMLDHGWKLIGGVSCYFDEAGVYHPEADPNRLLAFTFDDGPSNGTGELLDLCDQTGARISFFLLGNLTDGYGDTIARIQNSRCQLGSHSTDHTQMIKIGTEDCVNNFRISDELISLNGNGAQTDVYRFPYGDYTAEQLAAVGKPGIMWSLDSLDWDLQDTNLIIERVLNQIGEGDIILMHDIYSTTIEACRYLFPYLISQGYQLVTVKELAAAKGYTLEAGKSYFGFSNDKIAQGRVCQ
ncbi:MAG: polysaccharide deacetylase family protein [Lachnospiraceae bacterium]|nr:polysaccharide deacetylase family protein [Lachnospiraceae bacterium]